MKGISLRTSVVAIIFANVVANADEPVNRHPPEHAQLHEDFYSKWMRPDDPATSCCGGMDCAPVQIKYLDGKLYAQNFWDMSWIYIPPEKIDRRNTSPDGLNHGCFSKPVYEEDKLKYPSKVLCYMHGQGT